MSFEDENQEVDSYMVNGDDYEDEEDDNNDDAALTEEQAALFEMVQFSFTDTDEKRRVVGPNVLDFEQFAENEDVPSYEDQEADENSSFHPSMSGFTTTHLTPTNLNNIGCPMSTDTNNKWADYFLLFDAAPPLDGLKTTKARMEAPGREYNGVAFNPTKKTFEVFRYDYVNKNYVAVRLPPSAAKIHFAFALENEANAKMIVDLKNIRAVKFMTPQNIEVTMKLPFVPESMMRDVRKKATESQQAAVAAPVLKKKSPAKMVVVKPALAPAKSAMAPMKTMLKAPKMVVKQTTAAADDDDEQMESVDDDDDDDDDDDENEMELPAPKKAAVVKKEPAVPLKTKEQVDAAMTKVPANADREHVVAVKKRGRVWNVQVDDPVILEFFMSCKVEPTRATEDTPWSMEAFVSHIRYKVMYGGLTFGPSPLREKKTFGEVWRDKQANAAAGFLAMMMFEQMPHLWKKSIMSPIDDKMPVLNSSWQ